MKKLLILILLGLPFIITNCKEKPFKKLADCTESNTVKFPKDAVSRFYFKDSSYWVYKDSLTIEKDSVWVMKSSDESRNKFEDVNLKNKCYQYLGVELNTSSGKINRISFRPNDVNDNLNNPIDNEAFRIEFMYSQLNFNKVYRFFILGQNYDTINEEDGHISFISGYDFNGKSIDSVLLVENPLSNFDIYSKVWYAKNLGMIKYKLKNGSVWELKNYKIKQ